MTPNLYVHFPFCRRKCTYCSLYSRVGVSQADRDKYVAALAEALTVYSPRANFRTVYFGGGSPALCNLKPLFAALRPWLSTSTEFTVELHPLDVNERLLAELCEGGVNRISMGVQSFDDATLAAMGRGYTIAEALRAFGLVKRHFDNAGIDLIVGYPGDPCELALEKFAALGMRHCSVYSLQNERGLKGVPDDDTMLDQIKSCAAMLADLGLERYEISNNAQPDYECRHNLAVWRGEDYLGLGEGACGRIGLQRTRGVRREGLLQYETEEVTPETDLKERTLFRLRTREGLDASRFPEWLPILDRFVAEGLLTRDCQPPATNYQLPSIIYRLTPRGTEVCDAILAELV